MKTQKAKKQNLKGMTQEELKKELALLEESIRMLKFKAQGSRSKNVKEAAVLRKQVARILTKINQYKK